MATYEFPNLFSEKHEIEKIWVRRIRGGWMGASGLPRSTNVNVPMFSKSIKFQHEYIYLMYLSNKNDFTCLVCINFLFT